MPVMCNQCGKFQAIYEVNGHPICLNCYATIEQIRTRQQADYVSMLNFQLANMETTVGLPGFLPRYEVQQPIVNQGPINIQPINVDSSIVGSINTGQIDKLNIAMKHISQGGHEDLAVLFKDFTESVLQDHAIHNEAKNELVEIAEFLSEQAIKPNSDQPKNIIKMIADKVPTILTTTSNAWNIWNNIKPYFGM